MGAALDEVKGLDLGRTKSPVIEVIDQVTHRLAKHKMLFATQLHENVSAPRLDGTADLRHQRERPEPRCCFGNERLDALISGEATLRLAANGRKSRLTANPSTRRQSYRIPMGQPSGGGQP